MKNFNFLYSILFCLLFGSGQIYGQCDFCESDQISFVSNGGNLDPAYTTQYLIVDQNGDIVDVQNSLLFGNVSGGSYSVYAINYFAEDGVDNLVVGSQLSLVSGDCFDLSTPFTFEVCEKRDLDIQDEFICQGESVTLVAQDDQGVGYDTYTWSNGASTQAINVSPIMNAVYTVTVSDINGCSSTTSINVNVNSSAIVSLGSDIELCTPFPNVILTAGGTDIQSYLWSTGEQTNTISVQPTQTTLYTITVTDTNGCTGSDDLLFEVLDSPAVFLGDDQSICTGTSLTLVANSSADIFEWSTGETTSTIEVNPTETTVYSVTVTSDNDCIAFDEIEVTVTGACDLCEIYECPVECTDCEGPISFNASGENSSFETSYLLVNESGTIIDISNTTDFENVNIGTWFIFGVNYDAGDIPNGLSVGSSYLNILGDCFDISEPYIINVCELPTVILGSDVEICSGENTILTASGTPGTYLWSTGETTSTIDVSPIATTNYTVTVTSTNGCTSTDELEVSVLSAPTVTIAGNAEICNGESTTLTASGTTGTYVWSTGETTSTIDVSPIATTNYTVTVTSSNGCTSSDVVEVEVLSLATVTIAGNAEICNGESTTLTASGTTGTYVWSTGATTSTIDVNPTSTTTYAVTVTSSNGCTSSDAVEVEVLSLPTVTLGTDVEICNGESTTLTASGATGTYLWSTGATTSTIDVNPTSTTTYAVTVTSSNGCTSSDAVEVEVLSLPTVTLGTDVEICNGESTTLTASGTTGTYVWSTGATTSTVDVNPTSTTTYTVTVTSSNGCTSSDAVEVEVLSLPTVTLGTDVEICNGESTTLTASGTTGTYVWSTGATTSTVDVNPTSTTTYAVTVTSSNGCTSSDAVEVEVLSLPTVTLGTDVEICNGESTTLTASGTTGTYVWSTGATTSTVDVSPTSTTTYTVTVTSSNGCTSSDAVEIVVAVACDLCEIYDCPIECTDCEGPISFNASGENSSFETSYLLVNESGTILDISSTTNFENVNIGTWFIFGINYNSGDIPNGLSVGSSYLNISGDCFDIGEPYIINVCERPTVTLGTDVEICNGESTTLTASGTTGTYLWSTGATTSTVDVNPTSTTTYAVTVTSSNGCTSSDAVEVEVLSLPTVTLGTDVEICNGESTTLTASGTTGTYLWSTGATTSTVDVNPTSTTTYAVTVTSSNGCTSSDAVEVEVLSLPTVTLGTDVEICNGESTTLTASGTTGTYLWSTGATTSTVDVNPTSTTTYAVTVTSSNGCTSSDAVEVEVLSLPTVTLGTDVEICNGESTTLTASGTTGTYLWSTGATTSTVDVNPTSTTTYAVTVTSSNGCTSSDAVEVEVLSLPTVTLGTDVEICNGESTTLTASGTTGTYVWSTGATTSTVDVNPTSTTTYAVTVTSSNGCTSSDAVEVEVLSLPTVTLGTDVEICNGESTTLTASGTTGTYVWSTGATTSTVDVNPTSTTTYAVTVTSSNGCTSSDAVEVIVAGSCNLCETFDCPEECNYCPGEITFNSVDGNTSPLYTTEYILVSVTGEILDIENNPTFNSVEEGTYFIFAINYEISEGVTGLTIGENYENIDGECTDISDPFVIKVCDDFCSSSLGNYVFLDENGNGIQDEDEDGVNGVRVELYDANDLNTILSFTETSDVSNESGYYSFTGLSEGDYVVKFILPDGSVFSQSDVTGATEDVDDVNNDSDADTETGFSHVITLSSGEDDLRIDAGIYEPLSLGNLVWDDVNNNGVVDNGEMPISGVTVILYQDLNNDNTPDVNTLKSVVTDANGNYLFEDLAPGDYIVAVIPDNFDNGNSLADYISSTGNDLADGSAADADLVSIDNDDNGYNNGANIGVISKTVTLESREEPISEDGDRNSNLTVDFGFFKPAAIGNYVWEDANADGVQDVNEVGINDVTVTLFDALTDLPISTIQTMSNPEFPTQQGYYLFDNLTPGEYYVGFETPEGYTITTPGTTSDELDSDVGDTGNMGIGMSPIYILSPGDRNLNVDAGYYQLAKVGNFVWLDVEGTLDNVQDPEDIGVNGISVNLFNSAGELVATQITRTENGNEGYYMFTDVPVGTYYIQFDVTDDYSFAIPNQGDDDIDSDVVDFVNKTTLQFNVASGDCIEDIDAGLLLNTLPIELARFTANYNSIKNVNELDWETEIEINSDKFEIERRHSSENGFYYIGEQKAESNSQNRTEYNYIDKDIARTGDYFYRLKMIDLDGTYEYSEIRVARVERERVVSANVYPNPANRYINIDVQAAQRTTVKASLLTDEGRLVRANVVNQIVDAGFNNVSIDLDDLASGAYLLKIDVSGEVTYHKLLVVK